MLWASRSYPGKSVEEAKQMVRNAFKKRKNIQDEKEIEKAIQHGTLVFTFLIDCTIGEYVLKEIEALVSLSKYRTMKRNYYNDEL